MKLKSKIIKHTLQLNLIICHNHKQHTMPNEQRNSRYYKRSRSSSSHHSYHRERRPYDKDKLDRFDKYQRRSRSRSPHKDEPLKSKHYFQYQPKDDKRYYQTNRNNDKNKSYQEVHYSRRDTVEKRDREKAEEPPVKFKYYRNQQKQSKYRERDLPYEKREKLEKKDEREYKRRKSSPSRSRSSSRKRTQMKMVYNRRSPPRQKEQFKKNKKQNGHSDDLHYKKIDEQKPRYSPPKILRNQPSKLAQSENQPIPRQSFQKSSPNIERKYDMQLERGHEQSKPLFRLKSIPPPPQQAKAKRQQREIEEVKIEKPSEKIEPKAVPIEQPISQQKEQPKYLREQQVYSKTKANKFNLLIEQARHNLSIGPPKSTFLLLDTFRTMNKFQIETLDPKWMAYLKKDMDKYPEQRQIIVSKMNDVAVEDCKLVGKQYVWMKEERNQQELDLRFRFEQFKQHNANLSQLLRKIRFLD